MDTILTDDTLEMLSSLLIEIQQCGGDAKSFSWDKLKRMTAAELIRLLGPNKIRFTSSKSI